MGINVKRIKIACYMISAISAAIAAMMLMSRLGAARSGTAETLHTECVAAAVIGGTSLKYGANPPFHFPSLAFCLRPSIV